LMSNDSVSYFLFLGWVQLVSEGHLMHLHFTAILLLLLLV
jgi:hypothetical protein